MKVKIDLQGDRRAAENAILELRAAAQRLGLEIENIEVARPSPAARKVRKPASPLKPASRRKTRSRAD